MSKLPAREAPQRSALSPRTQAVLALIQGLLPALTAIVGGIWVAYAYLHQQAETERAQTRQAEQESRTRLLQAQKEFLDHQLNEYEVLAEIAARTVAAARARNGDGFREASKLGAEFSEQQATPLRSLHSLRPQGSDHSTPYVGFVPFPVDGRDYSDDGCPERGTNHPRHALYVSAGRRYVCLVHLLSFRPTTQSEAPQEAAAFQLEMNCPAE